MSYVIGLDYGTDSVRALLVDAKDGGTLGSSVYHYPRWAKGLYCDSTKSQYRQHPLDHLEGLEMTIREVLFNSGVDKKLVTGICVDTTGSSPMAVNEQGVSLALLPAFEENPNAMMILWKDHTAISEAAEITTMARSWGGEDFTKYAGGIYSSEWFWAKILSIQRKDKELSSSVFSWMEHCDFITGTLIGQGPKELKRSRCAAGHKALWHKDWDGLPPKEFLKMLDPSLALLRDNLYTDTYTSDQVAGKISPKWASLLGLSEETLIAVGTIDAHAGAVGAGIRDHSLVKVIGTSTCDMLIASHEELSDKLIRGICGQVDGSILPGFVGLEAGQAGFGDVLAWFSNLVLSPSLALIKKSNHLTEQQKNSLIADLQASFLVQLSEEASVLSDRENIPLALDWINGRRSPDVDETLQGAFLGLNMGTGAAHIFKSLVEALCFGSKKIVDRFEEEGLRIDDIIAIGGVANKSHLVMQTMADVLQRTIKITASTQTPALGAAMYSAVASKVYDSVDEAIAAMGAGFKEVYQPNTDKRKHYEEYYMRYLKLAKTVEEYSKISYNNLDINR